jgi:hypothetical protein
MDKPSGTSVFTMVFNAVSTVLLFLKSFQLLYLPKARVHWHHPKVHHPVGYCPPHAAQVP